jgi:lipopolysaccharide transport system permease protein
MPRLVGLLPDLREEVARMLAYLGAIWSFRYFWFSLVQMDLRARYRGSALGIGWSLLHPIAMTAIISTAFGTVLKMEYHFYIPYLMSGLAFWGYLTSVSLLGSHCFFQAEPYLRQHPTPLAIYPLRCMLGNAFHSLIAFGLVLVLASILRDIPGPLALLSLLPTFAMLMVFGWSMATFFGLINVRYGDAKHISDLGFQTLYFLTPVMYEPRTLVEANVGFLLHVNPFVPFLHLLRDPVLYNVVPPLRHYLMALAVVLTVFLGAVALLRYEERRLIFLL